MPAGSKDCFKRLWMFIEAGFSAVNTPGRLSAARTNVACPPAVSAADLICEAGAVLRHHRWPPPHSMNCSPGSAIGGALSGTASLHEHSPRSSWASLREKNSLR